MDSVSDVDLLILAKVWSRSQTLGYIGLPNNLNSRALTVRICESTRLVNQSCESDVEVSHT